ncbi:serine-rich adhesin for platelets [Lucilia cuprina]|uniref:serine-rich adhesin for platelets n=1 Tax=Lucilia cuprina TaxID=7375 RepID=UPI001F06BEEA|nr:serine-rich adhesin for platelets [Lucilia cuprina]XP_046805125.1 serine-rich adhesin for platelets [Lucilia cuprina]XP_046805126.1 serine-rich adhesin for platelets [Lucilia cuprina]XP_046805128.1 serine-rich adhesin for platelets [Lucilia cuprina]XP_046805129.1 serine-rich adhesin for platelets [Lucilia cuprina]
MWKCHKCGKPVYFAERKQSLGYDWHPECLRCEECGKRLNPGQHAEHKGVPYCHVPCYGALFGPQLFGHGTRVESHKSFGNKTAFNRPGQQNGPSLPRDHLESKLKVYNQFYDNKSMEVRSREVNNRLILEGALRVYWGVQGVIHLKEDDDQRTFVVRKRNSCRVSKADNDASDKENNDGTESFEAATTTSDQVDAISTDVSLSESMTFDSCSLNEYPELPTTPEDASAQTTGSSVTETLTNGKHEEDSSSTTTTLCDEQSTSNITTTNNNPNNCVSSTLPSKLDKLEKLDWDEIDDLLQVERRVSEKDKVYETMPVRLPSSSPQNSSSSTPTSESSKTMSNQNSTDSTNIEEASPSKSSSTTTSLASSSSSTTTTTSSDNFLTATASLNTTTTADTSTNANTTTSTTTTVDNYETTDDATLKPMDFEDFKRSVHQDYVNGANSFQEHNDDTLKRNQPIDPSRIHDSLKLYNAADNPMSKSFNCEHALRSIDATFINDTLSLKFNEGGSPLKRSPYALQKSGSAQAQLMVTNGRFEKGINRSKSGPSCVVYSSSDDDDDSTLKPRLRRDGAAVDDHHISATIRKSDIPPKFIQIKMNCYPKEGASDCDSSRQDNVQSTTSQSGAAAGDELTQTESLYTATSGGAHHNMNSNTHHHLDNDEQPLHVTEDGVVLRRPPRTGAAAIKRRSGNRRSRTKLKRRCSINGHFYNRETSFFTPPYGSQMSVWVTSLVTTQEVINLLLEKYRVDSAVENFSLFIIRDNGEQKRLKDNEYPLITRIMMGPHEDVAKLFLVDAKKTDEISNEVAQFLNLSLPECRAILERYDQELDREVTKVREKYAELRRRIVGRMESLKVHL